ncbi:hypothetical protein JCM19233_962 [Vibrio astriarenae]|nr:hypothetical protein JCM19233_962 [Vibrio sp. C7]
MKKIIALAALTLGLVATAHADPIQQACEQNATHAPSGVVESCIYMVILRASSNLLIQWETA